MKKFLVTIIFILLFCSNVGAGQVLVPTNYEPYQVEKSGYALNLAYRTTGNWKNCLEWYKLEKGRLLKVTAKTSISAGDTLYLPAQTADKVSVQITPLVTVVSTLPTSSTNQESTAIVAETTDQSFIKADFKKGLKDWNGTLGYSQYQDLNAGKEDETERNGYNWNGKLSFFPWEVKNWKFGPEVRYNSGKGEMKKPDYQAVYKYNRLEVGLKTEKTNNNQTIGIGLGVSKQSTSQMGSPKSQDTWSLHTRASYENKQRRARGEKVLPIQNFSAEYQHQLSTKTSKDAKEYNESTLSVRGKTGLYDLQISEVRVTPELNLETGYSWGKESVYVGGGPGLSIGTKKTDLINLRFWNPRLYLQKRDASRLETFAVSLKPDDIIRTIEASMVKKYKNN